MTTLVRCIKDNWVSKDPADPKIGDILEVYGIKTLAWMGFYVFTDREGSWYMECFEVLTEYERRRITPFAR